MLSRLFKTKRNRLLMGSVLITLLFFQNCMKAGLEGAGDSALGSGDSSQGGGTGGGNNPPPPPTMPTNQISVVATPSVSTECSQDSATLLMQVQDADADMRICLEYTLDVPQGSTDYGAKSTCTNDSSFRAPGTPWAYNSSQRTWTKPLIKLNTQTSYKPGMWRWHVRDNQGRENVTPYVKILRTDYKDCLPSTPKTPPPVPIGGITGDTGWGTGTWVPPGTSGFWVVDQSAPNGAGNLDYFPGCANFSTIGVPCISANLLSGRSSNGVSYSATMAQGNVLSVRFWVPAAGAAANEFFQLFSNQGLGLPVGVTMTFTPQPGDMNPANTACRKDGALNSMPKLILGPSSGQCLPIPGIMYYLNLMTNSPCSGVTCVFKLAEPASISGAPPK